MNLQTLGRAARLHAAGAGRVLGALCLAWAIAPAQAQSASAPASASARAEELAALVRDVTAVERSFAKAMADRDLDAFAALVAEDAVFRDGSALLLGRAAVVEGWRSLFKPGPAPFSWEPDTVTVSDAGTTALSSGPVFDPKGRMVARFTSVWRREAAPDGRAQWRIIVDQGVPLSECKPPPAQ